MRTLNLTPDIPGVPNTTPSSTQYSSKASTRAPIYNPFDKFTQPEFDSWIGDITSALKRALGQESSQSVMKSTVAETVEGDVSAYDEGVEDSFAEVMARRRVREKAGISGTQGEIEPDGVHDVVQASDEEDASSEVSSQEVQEEWIAGRGQYANARDLNSIAKSSEEVIVLSSDEDEEDELSQGQRDYRSEDDISEGTEEDEHVSNRSASEALSPPRTTRHVDLWPTRERAGHYEDEEDIALDELAELSGEEDFPPKQPKSQPPVLSDPWAGPSTFAEDFYSGGDSLQKVSPKVNPHLLPAEMEANQAHEIIDDEDYDEFPPATEGQPVDISDPWSGPRAFAEDFYSGGDIRGEPSLLSPSRLTPLVATPQNEDGTSPAATPGIIATELGFESIAGQSGARDAEEYETVVRTQGPSSTNELIASDLDDLYAELDDTPAVIVSQERETEREEGSFNVSGLLKPITPSPSFSAPPDPSPPPPRPSLTGHVDWNWPPAFSLRNRAPQSGHLAGTGEEALDNSDEDDEEVEEVKRPAALGSSDLNVLLPGANVLQAPKQALGSSNEASLDAHTPDKVLHSLTETTSAEVADLEREEALYTNFGSYMEVDEQDSTSYEPVSDNIDFGDLPPPPSNLYEPAPTQEDVLSILSQLEEMPDSSEPVSYDISPNSRKRVTPREHSSERTKSDPPLIEQVEEEVHGTFSMPSDASEELPYVVVEVEEDIVTPSQELVDTSSYAGDSPVAPLEFTVEEPRTEGRRIEEPEVHSMEPAFVTPSLSTTIKEPSQDVSQSPKMPDALSAIREITSHSSNLQHVVPENDNEDEQTPSWRSSFSRQATLLESRKTQLSSTSPEDSFRPLTEASVSDHSRRQTSQGSGELFLNEITERATSEDSIASSSASIPAVVVSSPGVDHATLDATTSSQALMFDSGIPMPVSADPGVPDPASFTNSPSHSSPALSEVALPHGAIPTIEQTREAMKPSSEAISEGLPPSLLRHIKDRSISGLFTPMSDGAVSSDSSAVQDEVAVAAQTLGLTESESPDVPGLSLLISGNEVESLPLDATQEGEKEIERGREPSSKVDTDIPVVQSEIPSPSVNVETIQGQSEAFSTAPEHSQEPATQQTSSQSETLPSVPHTQEDHVVDDDAEGEPDPEYHVARGGSSTTEPKKLGDSAPTGEKAPEPTIDAPITTLRPTPEPTAEVQQPILSVGELASPPSVSRDDAPEADVVRHPVETIPTQDVPETSVEPAEVAPSLKRKRSSPPPTPKRSARLTSLRNRHGKLLSQEVAVPAPRRGKGKEKALRESSEDEDKEVRSILSTQGSESIPTVKDRGASRTRATPSQPSSRSSSVVSSVPEHQIQAPPVPLIHAHGVLHHNHQRPGSLQPPSRPGATRGSSQPLRRQESLQNPPRKSRSPSLAPQSASQPTFKTTPTSTLVTRSNCRFHKISIPLEEGGPRIFFVVPGCSLSKVDLLKEEEIEDHGVLAVEENSRLVPDVEELNFDLYLVLVLRQLVGADYLRETEVFYLPQPGESIHRKPRRTHKPKLTVTSARLAAGPSSPHHSQASKRSPVKPPLSKGDSVSTASSFQTRRGQSNKQSISSSSSLSDSWLSEDSDIGEPVKRLKVDQPPASASQNLPPPSPAITASKQHVVRRSKRLGVDALAYKPEEYSSGSSSEEELTSKNGARKKIRKRGTKRSRTSEGASDDEGNDGDAETTTSKRRKMRQKTSGNAIGKGT